MTVIYSDFGDTDTRVLTKLWEGLKAKVIHLTRSSNISDKEINDAISQEEDTLLICGHGSPGGCFNAQMTSDYVISYKNVNLIKAKKVIGIWCHASMFAETFNLKGFFSYMFISNASEAWINGFKNVCNEDITNSEIKFCNIVNSFLKDKTHLKEWKNILDKNTNRKDGVEVFNYSKTRYFG